MGSPEPEDEDTVRRMLQLSPQSPPATPAPTSTPVPSSTPSPSHAAEATQPGRASWCIVESATLELLKQALATIESLKAERDAAAGKAPGKKPDKGGEEKKSDKGGEGPEDEDKEDENDEPIQYPDGTKVLGVDALRMRLRRMCEVKGTGKCWVDEQTKKDYKEGGERRQWLEMALLEQWKYNSDIEEFFVEDEETDVTSAAAPKGPRTFEDGSEQNELRPNPEVMPDLERFMETMNGKMSTIYEMIETLEDPSNPPPMDRYGLKLVLTRMLILFCSHDATVASYVEAAMIQYFKGIEGCKNERPGGEGVRKGTDGPFFVYVVFRSFKEPPKPPKSVEETPEEFQALIDKEKEDVKPCCADLITVDVQYKRLKKEIMKARSKREPEPEKPSKSKKPKKAKGASTAEYTKTKSKKGKGKSGKGKSAKSKPDSVSEEPVSKKRCISKRRSAKAK
eukprot:s333_g12.t1